MSIREVAQRPGPFASLYIDAEHDTEDAERQRALRWRALAERLAAEGASEQMITVLGDAVTGGPPEPGRAGRFLVADAESVLIDRGLPGRPQPEIVRVSSLPYLLPLIEHEAGEVPHAVAVVDRVGSDMYGVDEHGEVVEESVEGTGHPIHKVRHGGGWSHRSMQRRVEETARRNAGEVAEELTRVAQRVHAQVVVLAGEADTRSAVHGALGSTGARVVEVETGGRAEGSGDSELDDAVREVVTEQADRQRAEITARFDKAHGRDEGLAVTGVSETVCALLAANAENVLINADALGDRTIHMDPGPLRDPAALGAPGTATGTTCRADEALPVAALVRGGTVTPIGAETAPREGVGALLRYA